MAQLLQASVGVLGQAFWPGAGDVDDCWAVSDLQGVAAVAPWLQLVTIPKYREAADRPDLPGPSGGRIQDSAKALRKLYPGLGFAAYQDATSSGAGLRFSDWLPMLKGGRPSSVEIVAGSLPARLRHGFAGLHRVLVFWDPQDGWRILDPLAAPHSRAEKIEGLELEAAVRAVGTSVHAIVFATPAEAFRTHPLLAAEVALATAAERIRIEGVKGKVAALAADVADD